MSAWRADGFVGALCWNRTTVDDITRNHAVFRTLPLGANLLARPDRFLRRVAT
jgi:hypothetical protein